MSFLSERTYGIAEQYQIDNETDNFVEDLHFKGFSIIKNVLSADEIKTLKSMVIEIYARQVEEIGVENLKKMNDENIVRSPLCYNEKFVQLATHNKLMQICRRAFGGNFLLMQNGIINQPVGSQFQSRWHRDLNYQHWTSSKMISLNALFTLTDFTDKTGATYVLPATHLNDKFPSERYVKENELCAIAPPGSLIIMNAMLYHRAGVNISDAPRIGINHVIGLPFLNQQINYSECMEVDKTDTFLRDYLAFKWAPAKSPYDWRRRRL